MVKQSKLTSEQKEKLLSFIESKERDGAEVRRAQAVLHLDEGLDYAFITRYTRISRTQVFMIRKSYLQKGDIAFKDKRHSNRDRILTRKERNKVIARVSSKKPKDLITGCDDENWSTYWLGEYIRSLTGKRYKSKTSAYLIFKEAKLTWHKPGKVYDKADPIKQKLWKKETELILQAHWSDPNTIIFCVDEMVLSIKSTTQKVWLPQGEYPPIIETTGTRKNTSFYGFLNLKTGQEHTFITDYQNMYITKDQLIKVREMYPNKHLLFIWDNAGWHKGSQVTMWIQDDNNSECIYFPAYSPNMNPQEHVWKAGRQAVTHNKQIIDIKETAEEFKAYLESRKFPYELLKLKAMQHGSV